MSVVLTIIAMAGLSAMITIMVSGAFAKAGEPKPAMKARSAGPFKIAKPKGRWARSAG